MPLPPAIEQHNAAIARAHAATQRHSEMVARARALHNMSSSVPPNHPIKAATTTTVERISPIQAPPPRIVIVGENVSSIPFPDDQRNRTEAMIRRKIQEEMERETLYRKRMEDEVARREFEKLRVMRIAAERAREVEEELKRRAETQDEIRIREMLKEKLKLASTECCAAANWAAMEERNRRNQLVESKCAIWTQIKLFPKIKAYLERQIRSTDVELAKVQQWLSFVEDYGVGDVDELAIPEDNGSETCLNLCSKTEAIEDCLKVLEKGHWMGRIKGEEYEAVMRELRRKRGSM